MTKLDSIDSAFDEIVKTLDAGIDEVDTQAEEYGKIAKAFNEEFAALVKRNADEEELLELKLKYRDKLGHDSPAIKFFRAYKKFKPATKAVKDAAQKGDTETAEAEAKKADTALEEIFEVSPELKKAFSELTEKVDRHETRLNNHEGRLEALEAKLKNFEGTSAPRPKPTPVGESKPVAVNPEPKHAKSPEPQAKDDDATRKFDAVDKKKKKDIGPIQSCLINLSKRIPDNRFPEGHKRHPAVA